jgi:hypothetical protein
MVGKGRRNSEKCIGKMGRQRKEGKVEYRWESKGVRKVGEGGRKERKGKDGEM